MDSESPTINFQLANLLLENRSFGEAALEFEKETGQKWSRGAVIRVALSDFFTRRGKLL